MSEEEKKAIEVLNNKRPSEQMLISGKMCVNILLNLIEKQQKELKQKEEMIKKLEQDVEGYRDLSKQIQEDYSKQIREYEEGYNE